MRKKLKAARGRAKLFQKLAKEGITMEEHLSDFQSRVRAAAARLKAAREATK